MVARPLALVLVAVLFITIGFCSGDAKEEGWTPLFNGRDTNGWKLRDDMIVVKKIVAADGTEIKNARETRLDTKDTVVDAKGKAIAGATIAKIDGKDTPVDAQGKPIKDARIIKTGGRTAVVSADGNEIKDARIITERVPNEMGWAVKDNELICVKPHHGNDIYTEQTFTDFELHVEFQATGNSGVYLQGRYEIQVNNDYKVTPKIEEKDGKKIETLPNTMCGAIYGRIPPSENMGKPPMEWQSYDVIFHGSRGQGSQGTQKARVTLVWNGEKVIDNAEIDGPTGAALDGNVTEPGPILLQGDHGRVAFRNIKIKPLGMK
jgi:hypothetical protein